MPGSSDIKYYINFCENILNDDDFKNLKYDVWVGEWSLATDICAMWLGGFNESFDFPYQFDCEWVECPYSYLSGDLAVDFDRTAPLLGP